MPTVRLSNASEYPAAAQKLFELSKAPGSTTTSPSPPR